MPKAMREISGLSPQAVGDEILTSTQPLLLRGLVRDWPLVKAGLASSHAAATYLLRFYRGAPVDTKLAATETAGRYFYNDDLSGFNIAAHHDVPDNIACVAAGHRRFTVFPPAQLENLYIGPMDFNPAGQAISLVDFANPDLGRYPRFADAMQHAQVAKLGPGDAIFIPSLWWHHVESLDGFNVLVNYWWRNSPDYLGSPITALMHGILSLRDLPPEQREAWHAMFRHYVFEADENTVAHIPADARSALSPLDEKVANALRAQILKRLNR